VATIEGAREIIGTRVVEAIVMDTGSVTIGKDTVDIIVIIDTMAITPTTATGGTAVGAMNTILFIGLITPPAGPRCGLAGSDISFIRMAGIYSLTPILVNGSGHRQNQKKSQRHTSKSRVYTTYTRFFIRKGPVNNND
jgi:hypothetical protein